MAGLLVRLREEVGLPPLAILAIPAIPKEATFQRIAESQESHGGQALPAALEGRIHAMAERWGYTIDDVLDALEAARRDPAAWMACCTADERRAELLERAGMPFLP